MLIIAALGAFGAIIGDDDEQSRRAGTEASEEAADSAGGTRKREREELGQQNQKALPEDEQIERLVREVLDGKNNRGQNYLHELDVVEQIDGGWGVFVEFNADDNVTTNMRKTGIEKTMSEIYIALYTSEHDIRAAAVEALYPLVDRYGNENDGMVYKSILRKDEADSVNYDADRAYLQLTILPGVWTTSWLHPEFQK